MERKVAFYLLSMRHSANDEEISLKDAFQYICDKKLKTIPHGNKAIDLSFNGNIYVAQVIKENGDNVFVRIGRQHPSNTVALRDKNTLESGEVKMSDNQMLEVYTICLLDLSTGIVSYIGMSGAPKERVIREMFLQYDEYEERPVVDLAAILTVDVLKRIANKGVINSIECTIAVPPDSTLEDVMGIGEDAFDDLQNIKSTTMTFQIKADRNKTLFDNASLFEKYIDKIMGTKNKLLGMIVKAKNADESLQTFNVMENSYTKSVNLTQKDIDTITEEKLMDLLEETYNKSKMEIMSYIKIKK